jgi:hypothetical protein
MTRPYNRNFVPVDKAADSARQTSFSHFREPHGLGSGKMIPKEVHILNMMQNAQQQSQTMQMLPTHTRPNDVKVRMKISGIASHYDRQIMNAKPGFPALKGINKENYRPKDQPMKVGVMTI